MSSPAPKLPMTGAGYRLRVADWSDTPGARYRKEGPFSGQEYLEDILRPAFEQAREQDAYLTVDLDGTLVYATSFLEEAFGGLARGYGGDEVLDWLVLECRDEPGLVDDIKGYIRRSTLLTSANTDD